MHWVGPEGDALIQKEERHVERSRSFEQSLNFLFWGANLSQSLEWERGVGGCPISYLT